MILHDVSEGPPKNRDRQARRALCWKYQTKETTHPSEGMVHLCAFSPVCDLVFLQLMCLCVTAITQVNLCKASRHCASSFEFAMRRRKWWKCNCTDCYNVEVLLTMTWFISSVFQKLCFLRQAPSKIVMKNIANMHCKHDVKAFSKHHRAIFCQNIA